MDALRVAVGQHSQAGCKRVNKDFHGAALPAEPQRSAKGIAVALADSIGSSAVSQVASAAAVRGFLEDYYGTSEAWACAARGSACSPRPIPGCTRRTSAAMRASTKSVATSAPSAR